MVNHGSLSRKKRQSNASSANHQDLDHESIIERVSKVISARQFGGLGSVVSGTLNGVVGSTGGCVLGIGNCGTPVQNPPAAVVPAATTAQAQAPAPAPTPTQQVQQPAPVVEQPAQTPAAQINTPVAAQPVPQTTPTSPQTPATSNQNSGSNPVAGSNSGTTNPAPAQNGNVGSSGTTPVANNGNVGNSGNTAAGVNIVESQTPNPNAIATQVVSSVVNGQVIVSTATITGAAVLASASALSQQASILNAGGTITTTNAQGQTVTLAGTSAAAAAASSLSALISNAGVAGRTTAPIAVSTAFATQVQTTTDSTGRTFTTTLIQPVPSPLTSGFTGTGSSATGTQQPRSNAFIGIIVGVLAGVGLLIALVIFAIRRRRRVAVAAIPTTHNSQSFTDRAPSPVFTSFPVTFASRDEPSLDRLAASSTGRHASFGSSFREQFMPSQRTSANATHPYGAYAPGGLGQPVAAHYSSAPLLDVPLTPPITAFNGWQSASMPTFGNLTRLSGFSSGSGLTDQDSDTDSELAYAMEADSPMITMDPFRRSTGANVSSEEVYHSSNSRATSRQSRATGGYLTARTDEDDAGDLGGASPSDGFSIDSFETARAKRDSDYSDYSQSSDEHTATYHVGVGGARATLMDRRGLDPFRDSINSSTSSSATATAPVQSEVYASHLAPRAALAPTRTAADNARAVSALSYSSAGSSILNFKSDFPSSPERRK